jgi:hypothetical protein
MFPRQLPRLMERQGWSCVLAFLDIAKAYDTIERDFLVEAMQMMGADAGLVGWVQLILRNTASRPVVNGFPSGLVPIKAGVRQGCPLVPLLYLFLEHASAAVLAAVPASGHQAPSARPRSNDSGAIRGRH